MDEVIKWFENRDFKEGVRLYNQYGSSSFLKELFSSGESDYNRQKLTEELGKLCKIDEAPRPPIVEVSKESVAEVFNEKPTHFIKKINASNQTSIEYLKLIRRRDELNRQISVNMVLLDETRSKARRFETAKQIVSLDQKKREVWAQIDYFNENGELPPVAVKKEPKTDEIQRLYVQIWKAEKRLEKKELRNREKTEKLLKEKRDRLALLKAERDAK